MHGMERSGFQLQKILLLSVFAIVAEGFAIQPSVFVVVAEGCALVRQGRLKRKYYPHERSRTNNDDKLSLFCIHLKP